MMTDYLTLPIGGYLEGGRYTYHIEKVLGQGSFGITYLATTKMEGPFGETVVQVALKEFFMGEVNGRDGSSVTAGAQGGLFDKYKNKFVKEAYTLNRLKHSNIVNVLETFEVNNTVYYSMEYLGGESLDNLIKQKGRLTEQESLPIIHKVAEALQYMHSCNMLHLDVKPANIMMNKVGEPVLIDFGLSKHFDASGVPESSTTIGGGTPGYAPIEQTTYRGRDENGVLPVTMDVYALGGVLFKMLSGNRPPDASDLLNNGFPTQDIAHVSKPVLDLVEHAMNPMRRQRIQSMAEFISELSAIESKMSPARKEPKATVSMPDQPAPEPQFITPSQPKPQKPVAPPPSQPRTERPSQPQRPLPPKQAVPQPAPAQAPKSGSGMAWIAVIVAVVVAAVAAAIFFVNRDKSAQPANVSHSDSLYYDATSNEIVFKKYKGIDESSGEAIYKDYRYKMVYVSGGSFSMGGTSEQGNAAGKDEYPVHTVSLSNYRIGQTEVPQWLWKEVMKNNPSIFSEDERPVEVVTWDQCEKFADSLSKRVGKAFSLPTEAQWEYAARGGKQSRGFRYSGSNNLGDVAWFGQFMGKKFEGGNSRERTHMVGKDKSPNELDLYDMSGNVWEWCADWYGEYGNTPQSDPAGPKNGTERILRGGSWGVEDKDCRVSRRMKDKPDISNPSYGFRIVMEN